MRSKFFRYLSVLAIFGALLMIAPQTEAQQKATPAPTAAATDDSTITISHIDVPKVDWKDVSLYKKAMKQGHEADVAPFANANRYVILASLTLDNNAEIHGGERVRYTNHTSDTLNQIVFRLYPNAPALSGSMDVANVTVNGQAVQTTLSQDNSVMTVPLTQPLAPNQADEVTMDFDVFMQNGVNVSYGRFGYFENVVSGTAWYPTLSVYEAGTGWWHSLPDPDGDPAYTESGLYDVHLTVPSDVTVVMSGKEIDKTSNADGTVTHHSVTGPMRDQAFMASTRYTVTPTDIDGTRINVTHYKDASTTASAGTDDVVKYAKQAFDTYTKTFGDYPFAEFNVVENPTPTGVEFPGVIQIAESAWSTNTSYLETLVAHETGHQWFYSLVGNNQVEHPWLDESLTSYLEIVYTRAVYKSDSRTNNYINGFLAEYTGYLALGGKDQPLDLPVSSYSGAGYGAIVYAKGPLFFVALDRTLGLQPAYKAISAYFKQYEYKVATSAGMEKAFEASSGKDLSALFQKWVTGIGSSSSSPTATPRPVALLTP